MILECELGRGGEGWVEVGLSGAGSPGGLARSCTHARLVWPCLRLIEDFD